MGVHDVECMFNALRPSEAASPLSPTFPTSIPANSALSLRTLAKSFNGKRAVDGISLDVPRGSVFGVIGRSGAGKSTLLRMACLLETPDSGEVYFGSSRVSGLKGSELIAQRRRVGVVFQSFNLFSARTAGGNVAFPLEAAGRNRQEIRDRVRHLLGLVGLEDKIDRPVSHLSGGERQRVAIARALANQPEILFCDEATSALDPETTRSILDLIASLRERLDLTVFMVTHQMEVVRRACEQVAVIENGRVAEVAPAADLFSRPQSQAARHLVEELLPDEIRDIETGGTGSGPLYRLRFGGTSTGSPVLSEFARVFPALDANIMAGTIHNTRAGRSGELIISISPSGGDTAPDPAQTAEAEAWLKAHGVEIEEVQHE